MAALMHGPEHIEGRAAGRAALVAITTLGTLVGLAALVWRLMGWEVLRRLPITSLDGPKASLVPVLVPAFLIEVLAGWTGTNAIRSLRRGTNRRSAAWCALVVSVVVFAAVLVFLAVGFYYRYHTVSYIFGPF
jgi:hypothetical protein